MSTNEEKKDLGNVEKPNNNQGSKPKHEPRKERRQPTVPMSFVEKQTAISSIVAAMGDKSYDKTIMVKPFAVTHLQYNGKDIIRNYIDEDFFKQVVNQYWVENYGGEVPSSATLENYATAFVTYASKAEELFARMLQVTRVQNCFNLENEIVGKIGALFNDPDDLNIAEVQARLRENTYPKTLENVNTGKLKHTSGVYAVDVAAVSNAAWIRQYVSKLAHVYLPEQVINYLKFMFSGVIELSQDDDETLRYVCFWQPSNNAEPTGGNGQFPMLCDNTMTDFYNDYSASIGACQDLFSQYSALKPILERMGWKCTRYAADWSRDLEGKTLPVIRDDMTNNIEYVLNNVILAQSDILTPSDLLHNSLVYERNDKSTLLDVLRYPDRNIVISSLYNLENFLRGKVTSLCVNINTINRPGGATAYNNYISSYTADNYTVVAGTFAPAILDLSNCLDATTDTDALMAGPLHVIKVEGGIRGELDIQIIESRLEGSAKVYIIPETDIGQVLFCVNSVAYLDYNALKQAKVNTAQ